MQKLLAACLFLFLASCNSDAGSEETEDTTQLQTLLLPEDQVAWRADYDSVTGDMILKKRENAVLTDSTTVETIVEGLNTTWPDIQMVYTKTSGDTAYIHIPNSQYLTQQMGSSGPPGYFALVTYSLTEIPGVRFVRFDFQEGDHAMPGTFSRENFKSFVK